MYIHAKFPAGIDSQELYNDVKSYIDKKTTGEIV